MVATITMNNAVEPTPNVPIDSGSGVAGSAITLRMMLVVVMARQMLILQLNIRQACLPGLLYIY